MQAQNRESVNPWSNATWGWIATLCVAGLVLIFAFGTANDPRENPRLSCELKEVAGGGWYRLEGRGCSNSQRYLGPLAQFERQYPNAKLHYMGNNNFVARH